MKPFTKTVFIIFLLLGKNSLAQDYSKINYYRQPDTLVANSVLVQKTIQKVITRKTKKLNRYLDKESKSQKKLISKLERKEKKLLSQLKQKDSLAYKTASQKIGLDSIKKQLADSKTGKVVANTKSTLNKTVDSVKQLQQWLQKQTDGRVEVMELNKLGELDQINSIEQKLNTNAYYNSLINSRCAELKQIGKNNNLSTGLKSISKKQYYYSQKLKYGKEIVDQPEILEEKALAYLQTLPDFESQMRNPSISNMGSSAGNSMSGAKSVEELEKMGFQTKRQVKANLDKQLGVKTPEQYKKLTTKFNDAKKEVQGVKGKSKEIKSQLKQLGFKPNPMRGLPLLQRLTKTFNWQIIPKQGNNPVVLEINSSLGFKHTKALTYSLVGGASIGLGTGWRDIRLSNQGVRIGANTDWKWIWGISGQIGFERVYNNYTKTTLAINEGVPNQVITENRKYRDVAYSGIQKTYKLNAKYSGTMLIAYDWLWKQGNARSPIIWRVGWIK